MGGTLISDSRQARTSASISSTKSGFPSAAAAMRSRNPGSRRRARRSSRSVSAASSGSSSTVVAVPLASAPGGPHLEEFGAGHAEQQERSIRGPVGHVLDEVEQESPPPSAGRRTRRRAVVRAPAASINFRKPQAISSVDVAASDSPSSDRMRHGCIALWQRVELPDDLDHRPVRDPLAVGQTAPAHHAGPRWQRGTPPPAATCPRPATPRMVKSWHERSCNRLRERVARAAGARSRDRSSASEATASSLVCRDQAECRYRPALSLQRQRLYGLRHQQRRVPARASRRRSAPPPAPRPAPAGRRH